MPSSASASTSSTSTSFRIPMALPTDSTTTVPSTFETVTTRTTSSPSSTSDPTTLSSSTTISISTTTSVPTPTTVTVSMSMPMTTPASRTDLPTAFNTTTPGLVKGNGNGKSKTSTTLIAVISLLAVLALLASIGAFCAVRRYKRKSKLAREHEQYTKQRDANTSFWDKRIHDARGQGVEMESFGVGAGGRPVISGPFDARRKKIPDAWIDARDAMEAEKLKRRGVGEAVRGHIPTFCAERERRVVEGAERAAEQMDDAGARKLTTPAAPSTRHNDRPVELPGENPVVDEKFAVGSDGDESDDETIVEQGKSYRFDDKQYEAEAGPGPASMAYRTAGSSQEAGQHEAGFSSVPQRDDELDRSASLRKTGPHLDAMEVRGDVGVEGGGSFDHFGGTNPYKQKNESAWSDDSRERRRDRLAQGAKNFGSGIKGAFGGKGSRKGKKGGS
ncbi:hypothetical protein EG328_011695 [Venturia inaequalis]|uniref:Uncharacterized protein n=1 Tax=Venturia inaequalis TaxID=5025 RepID=A0A8H3VE53_VENIN|nr:hypothetical protein EG328_011695 [Venturia inaequalis]